MVFIGLISLIPTEILSFIKYYINKPKNLKGKICLVTGAGRGLGRELCLGLSRLGAEVICVDIREDGNNETVKLIKESGGKAHGYTCNIAKYQEVADLAETVQKEVGRVYMLINNAGLVMTHNAGEWPPEDVIAMFNVNVISNYWMIKAFLPAMKDVNEGHIVNVISISSLHPLPGLSLYGATKAANESMLRTLRLELNRNKNNKILVTGVHPSIIRTSDDITEMYPKGNLGMLGTKETAQIIIDEVRRDNTFLVIPKLMHPLLCILKFFPELSIHVAYDLLDIKVNIPSDAQKKNMIFGEINKKCR
ncbi:hypothetical protein O3M35_000959 [Rhynocoris fuscipes]|uniref:Uncharacterized protein n=1 Tax=Rhynocoris fuscipes TaxID=488301 RepID=A0AAW1DSZ6_9HEMI